MKREKFSVLVHEAYRRWRVVVKRFNNQQVDLYYMWNWSDQSSRHKWAAVIAWLLYIPELFFRGFRGFDRRA